MHSKNYESKLCFAEAFVSLVEKMPVDKITINMIAESLGKHRKTFYYHFANKNQLIVWIFRYDLALKLLDEFPREQLVWDKTSTESLFSDFPYYARNIVENNRIYNAPFFEMLAGSLEHRRSYYRTIFANAGPGTLEHYLYRLYSAIIKEDILFLIDTVVCNEEMLEMGKLEAYLIRGASVDFLADIYTGAFISRLIKQLNEKPKRRTADDIVPFENIIHDSLYLIIREKARLETGRSKTSSH